MEHDRDMTLRGIEGGDENPRAELSALLDDGVDPIVIAMRDAIVRGKYEDVARHAEDLRAAAAAIHAVAQRAD